MLYGVIKNIQLDRGFGFIGQDGGRDVYFHATDVGEELFQRLRPDQPVMFELARRKQGQEIVATAGPRAAKIELIDRIPGAVMDRPPQELAPRHHPKARQRKATWKRRIDVKKKGDA